MYIVIEYLAKGERTPPSITIYGYRCTYTLLLSPPQAAWYNISATYRIPYYHLILLLTWLPRYVQLWHILKSITLFTETWYVTKGNTHIVTATCTCYTQAARNCLVGETNNKGNVVKVGHFEMVKFVPNGEYVAPGGSQFPIRWSAPEVLTHGKFSSKSDVWSYGEHIS